MSETIGIIGTGNWGTTLAHLVSQNNRSVLMWGRNKEIVEEINTRHTNKQYTPKLTLLESVNATTDLKKVAQEAKIMLIVVPSKVFRQVCFDLGNYVTGDQILISCTKGVEEGTYKFMSDVIKEETCCKKVGVLSGPNIAPEIIQGDPSGAVIASQYNEVIDRVMEAIGQPLFKLYGNKDVRGVEIGGALKNIFAIASGMAGGMGLENNSKSFLITRGIVEISRFGSFFGASSQTFLGLSGIGDLIATCFSSHSRNNRLGTALAKGKTIDEALAEIKMAVEGIFTTRAVYELSSRYHISMPITQGIYRMLFDKAKAVDVLKHLMTVRVKYEQEDYQESFSDMKHLLVNKYPIPETLL